MKVLITLTLLNCLSQDKSSAVFNSEFRSTNKDYGYPIIVRAFGAMADKLLSFSELEKVFVYGSLWNRTKSNKTWLEVDYIAPSYDYIACFTAIGKCFKQPFKSGNKVKFPIVISRTIKDKHYYSIVAVGNAAGLIGSNVFIDSLELVYLEGFIELVEWANKEGVIQSSLKFICVTVRIY